MTSGVLGILWISTGSPNSIIKFRHDSEKLSLKRTSFQTAMLQSLGISALNDVVCFDVEVLGSWLNYRKLDINLHTATYFLKPCRHGDIL